MRSSLEIQEILLNMLGHLVCYTDMRRKTSSLAEHVTRSKNQR